MNPRILKNITTIITLTLPFLFALTSCDQQPAYQGPAPNDLASTPLPDDNTSIDNNAASAQPAEKTTEPASDPKPYEPTGSADDSEPAGPWLTGTVKYIDLEGGFYGIVDSNGSKYNPASLPDEFKKDGLAVRFRASEIKGVISFRMWGKLVKITDIKKQ